MIKYLKDVFKSKNIIQLIINITILMIVSLIIGLHRYDLFMNESDLENRKVNEIESKMSSILYKNIQIEKRLNIISKTLDNLNSKNNIFKLRLLSSNKDIKNFSEYQQTLRKEVKYLAENKIGIKEFWLVTNRSLDRIKWLEENKYKI